MANYHLSAIDRECKNIIQGFRAKINQFLIDENVKINNIIVYRHAVVLV